MLAAVLRMKVLFLLARCLFDDLSIRICHKAVSPKSDAAFAFWVLLKSDPIDRCHVTGVGDGVASLYDLPRIPVRCTFIGTRISDRRRVKDDLGPL